MTSATLSKLSPTHFPWRWALWSDYDPDFVYALKDRVYYRFRKWNREGKCWWFTEEAIEEVLFVIEQYCGTVEHVEDRATRNLSEEDIQAYMMLHLLPSAPKELVRAAYKAVAKLAHPDLGGSHEQMQAVNAAYQRLIVGGEYNE